MTVGLHGVRLAGASRSHLPQALVFAAGAGDVREVIVAGRRIVGEGRHLGLNVAAELRDAIGAVSP